jgi:hypothetical protein
LLRASANGVKEDAPKLSWIPRGSEDALRPPREFRDFQRSWFTELLWAMFSHKTMQGYLPVTSDLWKIAGAHRRDFWDANKSEVMAAFKFKKTAGCGEVMYFPPLIEVIEEQRKLVKGRRSRAPNVSNCGQKCGGSFISQSSFDFEVQKEEAEKRKSPRSEKPCEFCSGSGVRKFKPPRKGEFYCHCPIGVGRMAEEKYGKGATAGG